MKGPKSQFSLEVSHTQALAKLQKILPQTLRASLLITSLCIFLEWEMSTGPGWETQDLSTLPPCSEVEDRNALCFLGYCGP